MKKMIQKPKIHVFYGPRKEFEKKIKSKNGKENFSIIVQEFDRNNKRTPLYIEGQEKNQVEKSEKRKITTLIINSDEYSTITESAVQNIIPILEMFDIDEIYLQNPPIVVIDAMKRYYKVVNEVVYNYKKIDIETIKIINRNYSKKIIGQNDAIHKLLVSLLSFIKFSSKKPIVIMFYGPSGVGKTETAKYLSEKMGGKLFYKQFSMFQNNEFSNYLFGGIHSQNSFAKEILERNSNVILLDEFDKAHSHFYSAFYQLFDEGIYIDKNYKVVLENAIIICTSNYKTTDEIREKLGDPIYYRIDNFIEFKELNEEAICKIIDLKYNEYINMLDDKDKDVINKISYNNLKIIDLLKSQAKRINNVRKVESLIKELILDELLQNELKD